VLLMRCGIGVYGSCHTTSSPFVGWGAVKGAWGNIIEECGDCYCCEVLGVLLVT
jgi:hypothetical protein